MTKQAILYARVSTDEQAEHGYSLQSQLEAMRTYAASHALAVAEEITDDYSGAKLDRPGLDQARALLDAHQADAVIVFSPDRLTRSLAHSLLLREEFQRAAVELHYCNRGKLDDTPETKMTQDIEAVFGDYWRAKIIEGSRRGRHTKAANGRWPCDGQAPYGYRKEGTGREAELVIHEAEAAIVRRVFSLYVGQGSEPLSPRSIGAALTAEKVPPPNRGRGSKRPGAGWYKSTIQDLLKRRAYVGEFHYAGHTIYLPELAVIDQATFQAAQKRATKSRAVARSERKYDCLLAGHIGCACGQGMSAHLMAGGRALYYQCNSWTNKHMRTCKETMVRADRADAAVWEWLAGQLLDEERLDAGLREMAERYDTEAAGKRARLALLDDLIGQAEKKVKRLAAAFAGEADEMVAAALQTQLKQAGRERGALAAERDALAADVAAGQLSEADMATVKATATAIRRRLAAPTFEQKRELLNVLEVRVKIQYNEAERGIYAVCELQLPPTESEQDCPTAGRWLPLNGRCEREQSHSGLLPTLLMRPYWNFERCRPLKHRPSS